MKILSILFLCACPLFILTAQVEHIALNHNVSSSGGQIQVKDENGANFGSLEPDFTGSGGFMAVTDGNGSQFFFVEGNFIDNRGRVRISGNSLTEFRAHETGDDAVLLPADAVNSTEIMNEAGVGSDAIAASITLSSSNQTLASRTITAPSDGYVLVLASSEVIIDKTSSNLVFATGGISTNGTSLGSAQDKSVGVSGTAADAGYYFTHGSQAVYSIDAGEVATYYYLMNAQTAGGTIDVFERHISVLFIPTSYGSVIEGIQSEDGTSALAPGGEVNAKAYSEEAMIASEERAASILANQERIQQELDAMKAELDKIKSEGDPNPEPK